jgi:lipopolysaccharide transport system permease protein
MVRPPASAAPAGARVVIEAGRAERRYWSDLWRYRELFYFLAWRDIVVRYKQTAIGVAWALIRPALTIVVFTVVFGEIAKLPSGSLPYPLLVCAAILPWQFFASALTESSSSLVANSNLISKVYFPRLIIPVSAIVTSFADFLVSFAILVGLMLWYGIVPGWRMAALPLLMLLTAAAALGCGLWMTALNVRYRDFRHVIPFIVTLGLYVSPVGFSSDIVPEQWRLAYSVNPMVGVIDGFRWAVLGGSSTINPPGFVLSLATVALILYTGLRYFRATEKSFADII